MLCYKIQIVAIERPFAYKIVLVDKVLIKCCCMFYLQCLLSICILKILSCTFNSHCFIQTSSFFVRLNCSSTSLCYSRSVPYMYMYMYYSFMSILGHSVFLYFCIDNRTCNESSRLLFVWSSFPSSPCLHINY